MTSRDPVRPALRLEYIDPATLTPNPRNWRKHPEKQIRGVKAAIEEVGWAGALLFNERTKRLIDGHARRELFAGKESVPVLIGDWSEDEERKILASLDPLAGMADFDAAMFSSLVGDIDFASDDFKNLLDVLAPLYGETIKAGLTDEDAVPEPPANPVTVLGDLWCLGENRLECGDSTKKDDVARLMNGEKAGLMATDPPYLVDYQGGNHPQSWANKPDVKDKHWDDYHDPDKASDFFRLYIAVALPHLQEYAAIYQWHASSRQSLVQSAWEANGLHVHQTIIWVKARPVLTRCHYMWQFEPAYYGWVKGKSPKLKPDAGTRNVWNIDQQGEQDGIHPTQKPVELFRRPLLYHLEIGGLALEPFSGSGTAILAGQTTGRRVYAMELSPQFVDCAILRWQSFTGQSATLEGDGATFTEIARRRGKGSHAEPKA